MEDFDETLNTQVADLVASNPEYIPEETKSAIKAIADMADTNSLIAEQRKKNIEKLSENSDFQKASYLVDEQKVVTELARQQITTEQAKLENELKTYILKKQKEELDYRKRKEKKLIKAEVKAEVKAAKRIIAEKRFGYLYEEDGTYTTITKDENGKPVEISHTKYKDFSPSYTINKMKEIQNWYKNQTQIVQKVIWNTVRFFVIGGLGVGIIFIIIKALKWLSQSGILNNIGGA